MLDVQIHKKVFDIVFLAITEVWTATFPRWRIQTSMVVSYPYPVIQAPLSFTNSLSSVQSLSRVQLFVTPWAAVR